MTSSNAIAENAPGAAGEPSELSRPVPQPLPELTPETADATSTPFEILPGEAFGVCDLDGVCS